MEPGIGLESTTAAAAAMGITSWLTLVAGVYFLTRTAFNWSRSLRELIKMYFSAPRSRDLVKTYGPWAAVTGCTSGIGLGLIKEFAKQGMNVILISRSKTKLDNLASEIARDYKVKTKVIVADALDRESNTTIVQEIKDMDIGVFVNNVGLISDDSISSIIETDPDSIWNLIQVNTGTACVLNLHVLPQMIKKDRGIVVNVCSASNYKPVPYMQIYCATKAFLDTLTYSMWQELSGVSRVQIESLCTLFVKSSMTAKVDVAYNSPLTLSPEHYAVGVVRNLGQVRRTVGHILSELFIRIGHSLNDRVIEEVHYRFITYTRSRRKKNIS